jgi:hypothetical protein
VILKDVVFSEETDGKKFGTRVVQTLRVAFKRNDPSLLEAAITLWADFAFHSNTFFLFPSFLLFQFLFMQCFTLFSVEAFLSSSLNLYRSGNQ